MAIYRGMSALLEFELTNEKDPQHKAGGGGREKGN